VATDPGRRDDGTDSGRWGEGSGTYRPLLSGEQGEALRSRWERIQVEFVNEPRTAVEGADGLVSELMEQLSRQFSQVRADLEGQWNRGEQVSTEELRVALQRYRSFFDRLLVA
jgi:hypothetical protein